MHLIVDQNNFQQEVLDSEIKVLLHIREHLGLIYRFYREYIQRELACFCECMQDDVRGFYNCNSCKSWVMLSAPYDEWRCKPVHLDHVWEL